MKNYQYLTDGILESYLLGLASDDEKQEVERLLTTDPDILSQLEELETEMEQHFMSNAVPPPPALRTAIFEQINKTELKKREQEDYTRFKRRPVEEEPAKPNYIDVEVDDTHIRVHKYWRPAFIAVFVLSKIFLILGLYYYFKTNSLEQEITRLKAATEQTTPVSPGRTP
ncbi:MULTISPECIES: hypothetical protein [Spirosoma]|uniref:Anti-sigma factor n=1 Tax=Spirosoma liriopis TaxID=2937440 RepID=A0ABT0HHA1_9BACT|nr:MULTISPECIES: hypothetical protein [Spirosoma]MCK8491526.1 hypothetical protein [Spirosoma liriopis]UHG90892.1 hypothetical protein LQ777_21935 [Spirosoma oryzicola]